jgi:hypothetical protein
MNEISAILFIALVALSTLPASGHHAFAVVDLAKMVTLEGTITKVEWANPHVQISFDLKDPPNGQAKTWRVELESPAALQERGLARESFEVGGGITVTGVPSTKGSSFLRPFEVRLGNRVRWAARIDYH